VTGVGSEGGSDGVAATEMLERRKSTEQLDAVS